MLNFILEQFSKPDSDHFVVEGRWAVEALLENDRFEVVSILRAEGSYPDFDEKCLNSAEVWVLPKAKLSDLIGFDFHRGLLALARRPPLSTLEEGVLEGLWVVCPELADESNLGAIIRTASALGASGLLLPHQRGADFLSRKSIRASSGAVFRLPILGSADLASDIARLKGEGFTVVATYLGDDSIPLHAVPEIHKGIVIFGPEKGGLTSRWLDLCDVKVAIPMANGMDSLNVAACAAIVIYQLSTGIRA